MLNFTSDQWVIVAFIFVLGLLVGVAVGAALAFKRRGEPRVALTFFGDSDETLQLSYVQSITLCRFI